MNPFKSEIAKIKEGDVYYYVLNTGLPLYKATNIYNKNANKIVLDPNGFYFFGVKNEDPKYIASYEKLYGVIHEFKTTREYKLLAFDESITREYIHKNAKDDKIKTILKNNYGHTSGIRDSDSNADRELSKYLCSNGYDGYAIHDMATDFGGKFHDEFMICNIDGIEYVKMVSDKKRIPNILGDNEAAVKRPPRKTRKLSPVESPVFSRFVDFPESPSPKTHVKRRLFGGKKTSKRRRKSLKRV